MVKLTKKMPPKKRRYSVWSQQTGALIGWLDLVVEPATDNKK